MSELRDELQKAEDLRFEHEEEMWRLHELHKSEIAEQRRVLESLHGAEVQEHRQVLTMLMDEHERSQVEAELDIEEAKRRLTEDARAGKNSFSTKHEKQIIHCQQVCSHISQLTPCDKWKRCIPYVISIFFCTTDNN